MIARRTILIELNFIKIGYVGKYVICRISLWFHYVYNVPCCLVVRISMNDMKFCFPGEFSTPTNCSKVH